MGIIACVEVTTTILPQTTGTPATTPAGSTSTGAPLSIEVITTPGIPSTTAALSTTGTPSTTRTSLSTTPSLPPTTTTMNYCVEENGMNQPLTIQPNQFISYPSPNQTTPSGNINPTSTTPGLDFPTKNPKINVTLDQPATLTVIYVPVDRPKQPSNVNGFTVVFVYPNGDASPPFNSEIPSGGSTTTTTTTTTPSSGVPSETTTTPSTSGIVPPSDVSPQVDLPTNFRLPTGTVIVITITSTNDKLNPHDVSIYLSYFTLILKEDK